MAAESLLGGDVTLDQATADLLDFFFEDTVAGTTETETLDAGGTILTASGGDTDQAAITPSTENVEVTLDQGVFDLDTGMAVFVEGTSEATDAGTAATTATTMLEAAIPDDSGSAAAQLVHDTIVDAINTLTSTIATANDGLVDLQLISVDASSADEGGAVAVDLTDTDAAGGSIAVITSTDADTNITVTGTDAMLVVGDATITSNLADGSVISTDTGDQVIIGGDSAEEIVITGGIDTVTGGAGADIFAMSGSAVYDGANIELTINDYDSATGDTINFDVIDSFGITTLAQLGSYVTQVDETATGVTVHFGDVVSISLVGLDLDGLAELDEEDISLS